MEVSLPKSLSVTLADFLSDLIHQRLKVALGRAKRRIWIDALTPKQVLFTKAMIERKPSNVELEITTRDYSELNRFVKQISLRARSFGKHGGALPEKKLEASIQRMSELTQFAMRDRFDCSFSFISPEAARVSFGLGLPHFICSDSPHASFPSRLSIPLATKLFSPFPIRKERWVQFGIKSFEVFFYHALDPWAWISPLKNRLKRSRSAPSLVLVRLEESFASYVKSGKGISDTLATLIRAVKSSGDHEILLVPRYDEQRSWARRRFGETCTVPDSTINGLDMISKAALVIGGGGTMTQEAALLGVPNISYFPSSKLDVFENFYFPKKLSVKAITPNDLVSTTSRLLENIDAERSEFSRRSESAVKGFEDPVKFVFENLLAGLD